MGGETVAQDDVGDAVSMHDRSDGPGQACSSASSPQLGQSRRCNVDQGWLIVYTLTSVDRTSTNRKDIMSVPSQKRQGYLLSGSSRLRE